MLIQFIAVTSLFVSIICWCVFNMCLKRPVYLICYRLHCNKSCFIYLIQWLQTEILFMLKLLAWTICYTILDIGSRKLVMSIYKGQLFDLLYNKVLIKDLLNVTVLCLLYSILISFLLYYVYFSTVSSIFSLVNLSVHFTLMVHLHNYISKDFNH